MRARWQCDVCGRFVAMTEPNNRRAVPMGKHVRGLRIETRCGRHYWKLDTPTPDAEAP